MRVIRARIEWKLQDMWIGVFWKHGTIETDKGHKQMWTDVWVCFVPCLPLHLTLLHDVTIPLESVPRGGE